MMDETHTCERIQCMHLNLMEQQKNCVRKYGLQRCISISRALATSGRDCHLGMGWGLQAALCHSALSLPLTVYLKCR